MDDIVLDVTDLSEVCVVLGLVQVEAEGFFHFILAVLDTATSVLAAILFIV